MKFTVLFISLFITANCKSMNNKSMTSKVKGGSTQGSYHILDVGLKLNDFILNSDEVKGSRISLIKFMLNETPPLCLSFEGPMIQLDSAAYDHYTGYEPEFLPEVSEFGVRNCDDEDQMNQALMSWYQIEIEPELNHIPKKYAYVKIVEDVNGDYVLMSMLYHSDDAYLEDRWIFDDYSFEETRLLFIKRLSRSDFRNGQSVNAEYLTKHFLDLVDATFKPKLTDDVFHHLQGPYMLRDHEAGDGWKVMYSVFQKWNPVVSRVPPTYYCLADSNAHEDLQEKMKTDIENTEARINQMKTDIENTEARINQNLDKLFRRGFVITKESPDIYCHHMKIISAVPAHQYYFKAQPDKKK